MQEKFVNNTGVNIQYIVMNYSPGEIPVIIIPGAINGAEDIYNEIKDYTDLYCIIVSIRGRGKSGSPLKGYTNEHQVSDINAVVSAELLESFYMLGHSYGAGLASSYAVKYPYKINGLILVDFPAILPAYNEQWADYIKNNIPGINSDFINGMVTECIYENFEDELVKLDFKKLIIKGSGSDSLLKPQSAERLMAKLPNASFKIIEGGGHELFSEKPAEILTEIEHFI
jgi:pimeloyl-ACP methyl ester carboxylesterase